MSDTCKWTGHESYWTTKCGKKVNLSLASIFFVSQAKKRTMECPNCKRKVEIEK